MKKQSRTKKWRLMTTSRLQHLIRPSRKKCHGAADQTRTPRPAELLHGRSFSIQRGDQGEERRASKKSPVAWLASGTGRMRADAFFNLAGCHGNSSNELAFSVQRDRDTRRRSNNFGIVPLESRLSTRWQPGSRNLEISGSWRGREAVADVVEASL